jgi:hypothetical protein
MLQPLIQTFPSSPGPLESAGVFEHVHLGRQAAEANGPASSSLDHPVDERRESLTPWVVGRKQIRLMPAKSSIERSGGYA